MGKIITILVSFFNFFTLSAQELNIKVLEYLSTDPYASINRRIDANGDPCAVVRVSLPIPEATFSGNIVGNITRQGAEYIIYITSGSKKIRIEHPNYHSKEIVVSDYGFSSLQGLSTYRLIVEASPNVDNMLKKQMLSIKVTPNDAIVQLDGDIIEEANTMLKVGTHKYNVVAKGYYPQEGTIEIRENIPAKLIVELDSKNLASNNEQSTEINHSQQHVEESVNVAENQPQLNFMKPQTFDVNGVSFNMIPVEGGTFTMGATPEMKNAQDDEIPSHQVGLNNYYIGETEVTQELWETVMGYNPSFFNFRQYPVENVSWQECQIFIKKINKIIGKKFRLPTEAEWEFAARGGNKSKGFQYSGGDNIDELAWYADNCETEFRDMLLSDEWQYCEELAPYDEIEHEEYSDTRWGITRKKMPHPVKLKLPNELGIFDMTGNVWEWCQDWFGDYNDKTQYNPKGNNKGKEKVFRGGSWENTYKVCHTSCRSAVAPDTAFNNIGFRLVLSE